MFASEGHTQRTMHGGWPPQASKIRCFVARQGVSFDLHKLHTSIATERCETKDAHLIRLRQRMIVFFLYGIWVHWIRGTQEGEGARSPSTIVKPSFPAHLELRKVIEDLSTLRMRQVMNGSRAYVRAL